MWLSFHNGHQVQLEDTNWSFPIQIVKEDTIYLVLRRQNGTRRFLRTEIRGYEEGSRFVVVFRLGSTNGPIRYVYVGVSHLPMSLDLQLVL